MAKKAYGQDSNGRYVYWVSVNGTKENMKYIDGPYSGQHIGVQNGREFYAGHNAPRSADRAAAAHTSAFKSALLGIASKLGA
jgi:hypothetical protein